MSSRIHHVHEQRRRAGVFEHVVDFTGALRTIDRHQMQAGGLSGPVDIKKLSESTPTTSPDRRPASKSRFAARRDRSANSAYVTTSPTAAMLSTGRPGFVRAWAPGYINTSLDVAFPTERRNFVFDGIAATDGAHLCSGLLTASIGQASSAVPGLELIAIRAQY